MWIFQDLYIPRDPGSPSENGFMEPKYYAFRMWLDTPIIIIWQSDWIFRDTYLGVCTDRGTPKWMVYFTENPIKMDDLGGLAPLFLF